MVKKLFGTALALCGASCAPDAAPPPAPTATPTAAAAPAPAGSPAAAATRADDHATPHPGEQKTFGDWTVACDNTHRCTMASLGPDGGDFPTITVQIARNAGPDGGYEIALGAINNDTPPAATLVVGTRRFTIAGGGLSGAAAAALVAAIVNAPALQVRDAKDRPLADVSLKGIAAALRYVDALQGRADTVTAAVARGARPADAVPAALPAPHVAAIAFTANAAELSAEQIAQMRRIAACEGTVAQSDPTTQGTADGTTLVLLPCSTGAYNQIDALFTFRNGQIAPAQLDAPAGFDATGADSQTPVRSVVNGTFDGGALTSYAKGRGLGDCGVTQRFVWDGRRLRLIEQRAMGECRGNPDYLTVWRAAAGRE